MIPADRNGPLQRDFTDKKNKGNLHNLHKKHNLKATVSRNAFSVTKSSLTCY